MSTALDDRALSAELDQLAASIPHKSPITLDPKLWEAFAVDRERPNRRYAPRAGSRGRNCLGCEHLLRPKGRLRGEFPNTYEHAGKGRCGTCLREYNATQRQETAA